MLSLGVDLGSSSVKTAIVDANTGEKILLTQYPPKEMPIRAPAKSWAEQDPEMWWDAFLNCIENIRQVDSTLLKRVKYIGISYQMHGLVIVDAAHSVLRPSIIWCDSRAVEIGENAFLHLGQEYCLGNLLNSPGNFTASKLKWVKDNEPDVFARIHKFMLPGDFLAMKLSGVISSTITGLSEGVFWDFRNKDIGKKLPEYYGFDHSLFPDYKESFAVHAGIHPDIAVALGISEEAIISYKAGDQPNNALSLDVLRPGEIAATAGTSGVVYGVVDQLFVDEMQRVNSFAHVNYSLSQHRIGVLLCINGVGISNAWVKRNFNFTNYDQMNSEAALIAPGAEGLFVFPFGNGAERMLGNKDLEASFEGLNYNVHHRGHFARAVQEGIAFSFAYGMEAFKDKKVEISKIKAGYANMFLSNLFVQTLADTTGVSIELYDTDGSVGAARGALIGAGVMDEISAFSHLQCIKSYEPRRDSPYLEIYARWKSILLHKLNV